LLGHINKNKILTERYITLLYTDVKACVHITLMYKKLYGPSLYRLNLERHVIYTNITNVI